MWGMMFRKSLTYFSLFRLIKTNRFKKINLYWSLRLMARWTAKGAQTFRKKHCCFQLR